MVWRAIVRAASTAPQSIAGRPQQAKLFGHLPANLEDLGGERNPDRTNRRAGIAGDAQRLRPRGGLEPMVKGGIYQPDRAGVDVAEDVAADDLVGRADVGAGRA